MSGLKYYVIDIETTGLKKDYHEMSELSIIRAEDRMQLTRMVKCNYPERASLDALEITKKTFDDLRQGTLKSDLVREANEFFSKDGAMPAARCIVGHNIINFDKKFLHALWESEGQEFPAHLWLDTITLTKKFLESHEVAENKIIKTATGKISTTLHASCDMTGVNKIASAHNAKSDTRNTYMLWKKLVDEYEIDYLPHIKNFPHVIKKNEDELEDIDELISELGDI